MKLQLQTWGGIGDVLREISLLPVDWWHRRTGQRVEVRHLPAEKARLHQEAASPTVSHISELITRIPALQWMGEGTVSKQAKAANRILRSGLEYFPGGNRLYRPKIEWRHEDELPNHDRSRRRIVVQSHLAGLPSKRWSIENWRTVLASLETIFPDAQIHLLDPVGKEAVQGLAIAEDQLSLPQAIRLVEEADLLIAVDSWSKYVAGWHNIPQLVIVPDQQPDYPQLTPKSVWRYSFRGLHRQSSLKLFGLQPSGLRATYTMGQMADLRPEMLIATIDRWAKEMSRNGHLAFRT